MDAFMNIFYLMNHLLGAHSVSPFWLHKIMEHESTKDVAVRLALFRYIFVPFELKLWFPSKFLLWLISADTKLAIVYANVWHKYCEVTKFHFSILGHCLSYVILYHRNNRLYELFAHIFGTEYSARQ